GREIRLRILVGIALLCVQPQRSLAQEPAVLTNGQREYQHACAVCHGTEGQGNGPMADLLKKPPPDLTQLSKRNGGQFPFWRVYPTIDGRGEVMSHGPRTMQGWGADFRNQAGGGPLDENRVLGRILSLVYYLESLQDKQR